MVTRSWELVYGRQPVSRDTFLFLVALVLHLPLFMMEVKAPLKGNVRNPLIVIQMREAAIDRVVAQGMVVPPPVLGKVTKTIDLSHLIKPPVSLPTPTGTTSPKLPDINRILAPAIPAPLVAGGVTPLQVNSDSKPLSTSGVNIEKIIDRGQFLVAKNTIGSIETGGGHSISVDKTQTIVVPSGASPRGELGLVAPSVKSGKILLAPPPSSEPALPTSGLKKDTHAGAPITFAETNKNKDVLDFPAIQAKPRDLTKEQRLKELFPVRGELKDRGIDYQEIPEYPEWARKKGIEASVQFQFWVTPDGRVKENINLIRTSGYPELDELAQAALSRWVFKKLPSKKGNIVEEGSIEFRFSLK
ncbi:MAG: energy transducer TonB [Elusimicrobia bacterium]|nr:energy transducer TonB [Elusimicrobiota bacterium]